MTDVQGMKDLNLREDTRFQQAPQPDMVSSQVCLDAGGTSMPPRLTQSFGQYSRCRQEMYITVQLRQLRAAKCRQAGC